MTSFLPNKSKESILWEYEFIPQVAIQNLKSKVIKTCWESPWMKSDNYHYSRRQTSREEQLISNLILEAETLMA